jgi:hypothetical protein
MTLETNEQILHQMNINLELLEVSDCRLTHTLSVTSTTKSSCIKTVLDKNKIQKIPHCQKCSKIQQNRTSRRNRQNRHP